jgi:hypothetical protein
MPRPLVISRDGLSRVYSSQFALKVCKKRLEEICSVLPGVSLDFRTKKGCFQRRNSSRPLRRINTRAFVGIGGRVGNAELSVNNRYKFCCLQITLVSRFPYCLSFTLPRQAPTIPAWA